VGHGSGTHTLGAVRLLATLCLICTGMFVVRVCLLSDSCCACAGLNGVGQLGTGDRLTTYSPAAVVQPPLVTAWVQVSAGNGAVSTGLGEASSTCAIASSGTAWCWGASREGQGCVR